MGSINMLNYLSMVSNKNIFNGAVLLLSLSVTINAAVYGNPFHAVTFGMLTVISIFVLLKNTKIIYIPQKGIRTIIALTFIIIGLWYPEFMNVNIIK